MGMRFSYTSVLPISAEQRQALLEETGVEFCNEGFVTYDYDESVDFPEQLDDFGTRELSERYGETIYLLYYDGAAAELCGTILYEHSHNGKILRALAYSPNLWTSTNAVYDEELHWRRIEGNAEEWEVAALKLADRDPTAELQQMIDCGYEEEILTRYQQNIDAVLSSQSLQLDSLFPNHVQDAILHAVECQFGLRGKSMNKSG